MRESTAQTLVRRGIRTIGDLAKRSREELKAMLGKGSESLWLAARGLDDGPVRCYGDKEPVKSIGNSTTFAHDLVGREVYIAGLTPLCEGVGHGCGRSISNAVH